MSMPMESLPGLSLTSFGFMVERYTVFFAGALPAVGSIFFCSTSRMPQIGQSPGLSAGNLRMHGTGVYNFFCVVAGVLFVLLAF